MQEIPQHGSTAETFLPRLVARLHRSGFEGVAKISLGIAVRAIYFRAGEIASAASNDEQDRLQSLLLKEGRLTTPQVEMARSRQKPGVSLGKTLIEMGFLTPSELLECARRQVRQILATCFEQAEGEFHLEPGPLPAEVTILGLPTRRLIFDALMEVGDRRRVVREMGSMESVYTPTDDLAPGLATLQLDPSIDQVARAIDGVRSMRDLSGSTSHDDFTLSKAILALEILGLVDRHEAPHSAAPQPERGRIIPVESESPEPPPAPLPASPDTQLDADVEEADEAVPAAGDEPAAGGAEPPEIPAEALPAFAVPPTDSAPPQWSTDPKTGERIHEGPIEMTFDGLVRSEDRQQAVSTRMFAITGVVVALVVLAYFLFAPGSQKPESRRADSRQTEQPNIAGIGDRSQAPPAGSATAAAHPESPGARRSSDTETTPSTPRPIKVAAEASQPPSATSKITAPVPGVPSRSAPPAPSEKDDAVEEKAPVEPPASTSEPARQEIATPPAEPAPSTSVQQSADYLAAAAELDGGRLPAAAQSFEQLIAAGGPGGFTLQLMIACQPDTVKRARAQSGEDDSLFVLPYSYKGQNCFRTCWGIYSNKEAARAAVGRLPRVFAEAGIKPIVVALERLRGTR